MNTKELITALVDDQLKETKQKQDIRNLISDDKEIEFEMDAQLAVKKLLRRSSLKTKAPDYLSVLIQNQIEASIPQKMAVPQQITPEKRFDFFAKPFITMVNVLDSVALAAMELVGIKTDANKVAGKIISNSDLFKISEKHFKQILNDEPCHNRPMNIDMTGAMEYFSGQLLSFDVELSDNSSWSLNSAFVCDCSGKNIAHSVFNNREGKTLHLIQMDESQFQGCKDYLVSNELNNYLTKNRFVKNVSNDKCVIVWKANNRIFTLLTDALDSEPEINFVPDYI